MVTTTLRQIISDTLKLLAVLDPTEAPSPDAEFDCQRAANSLIDSWGTQPQTMYTVTRSETSCASGVESYTIGPTGDFDMARPVMLQGAGFLIPDTSGENTVEQSIPVVTDDMYRFQQMKLLQNSQPTSLYYNPTNTTAAGFGRIYLWPVLNQTVTIVLYVQAFVSQFADLTTSVILNPGLERALRYNLALEIAPLFTAVPSPLVVRTAGTALAEYKRSNVRMSDLPSDALVGGNRRWGYNINTGTGG
jgi:hypothetical protein